jgi:hypothetical protein
MRDRTALRQLRAHIVQHCGRDQVTVAHRHRHGDDAAHRSADEHGAGDAQLFQQLRHIARIHERIIVIAVAVVFGFATATDIHRYHAPPLRRQPWRHHFEVGAVARQTVDADDGAARRTGSRRIIARHQAQTIVATPAPLDVGKFGSNHRTPCRKQKRRTTLARRAPPLA